jgi:hypothetical protein
MSNTTKWYVNDGQGNGYFAPGWDNQRIARRTGILRWIALGLATLILGVGGVHLTLEYGEQIHYNRLKSGGIETTGIVGPVTVEHSTRVPRQSGRKYITQTTATVDYLVHGQVMHGEISASSSASSSFGSTARYPDPAWTQGQRLTVYVDPANPERFVLFHEYKEADAQGMPRGAMLVLIFTAGSLLVPLALFWGGVRNVREARKL